MQDEMVIYNGKAFPKKGFRVFVYGKDGSQKLVNSWEQFEEAIQSGAWFSRKENINAIITDAYIEEKSPKKRKRG